RSRGLVSLLPAARSWRLSRVTSSWRAASVVRRYIKMKMRRALFLVVIALTVAGCTTMQGGEARSVEQMLAAAGFQMKVADTPEKAADLRTFPTRKMTVRRQGAALYYVYADPDVCNCLYMGTEPQYQEYQRLLLNRVADERLDMNWALWGPGPL